MRDGSQKRERLRVLVRGAVQGVGFRPYIYRLATGLELAGWVANGAHGVRIEAEGGRAALEEFLLAIERGKPPRSHIQGMEAAWLDAAGYNGFVIRPSAEEGPARTLVLPDIASCPECVAEIFDPANRRWFYPFTNCTQCGPRFSIIEALPYDRARTTMKGFAMCAACQAEYDDPQDRRFHAQPNACPVCGPQLRLWNSNGRDLVSPDAADVNRGALAGAARAIVEGQVLALKGIGGFHLLADAANEDAVRRLRERKQREEKPFALMFSSLAAVRAVCAVSALEERLLRSPEAPIVLLRRLMAPSGGAPVNAVAPGNPWLGVMLPYAPAHHLLLSLLSRPLVATSGNRSDEPICIDEREALDRLGGVADLFLIHNRPIARQVDDSVARVFLGRELVLRRARGYAPLPVELRAFEPAAASVLAVGAHLKNTVALSVGAQAFLSQHIGDLETEEADAAFRRVIADFQRLFAAQPSVIACDAHPDYASTRFARSSARPASPDSTPVSVVTVQHHLAHVLSCMAENDLAGPALGVAWDGTGFGLDGTAWGGEFFLVRPGAWRRFAHWRTFPLPGGDAAAKEPRRTAMGLLFESFGARAFAMTDLAPVRALAAPEASGLQRMLERGLNSPRTSSAGRLFDAVASLAGLRQRARFEGQAAMELEFALGDTPAEEAYPVELRPGAVLLLDWQPLVEALLRDLRNGAAVEAISRRFHNALAEAIVCVAGRAGQERVALSGGCFQNIYLAGRAVARLRAAGFRPYRHQRVPPNDGGIALGQIAAVRHRVAGTNPGGADTPGW